jgi:hypothetical protein
MKKYILSVVILLALLPLHLFSQTVKEDVVYMKNGTIYRGTIIEQIPNVSYKIEIAGGSQIQVKADDVTRIIKEDKFVDGPVYYERPHPVHEFHYRDKGYFIEGQALAEAVDIGLRVVNGYKFGQYGYLGVGVGVESLVFGIQRHSYDFAGTYIPIYLYYGGDILQQHITPFYSLEAGYAFHPNTMAEADYYYNSSEPMSGHGGFMAGAGFGVRFYSRRRVHFDLSAHIDFKMATENYENDIYNQNTGNTYQYFYSTSELLIIPGLRFGVGF